MRDGCVCFCLKFDEPKDMCLEFGEVIYVNHDYDPFAGPYDVTSRPWDDYKLETKDKNMIDDVIVHKIPYAETANDYGTTVSISS